MQSLFYNILSPPWIDNSKQDIWFDLTVRRSLALKSSLNLFYWCQYLELMEQFKDLHKTVDQLRTSGLSTGEIKKVSTVLVGLLHTYIHFISTQIIRVALLSSYLWERKILNQLNYYNTWIKTTTKSSFCYKGLCVSHLIIIIIIVAVTVSIIKMILVGVQWITFIIPFTFRT